MVSAASGRMPDPSPDGPCETYVLGAGLSRPHDGDRTKAKEIYTDCFIDDSLREWRRAGDEDPTLREDFEYRPSTPARHKSFPCDSSTAAGERLANKLFF